MNKSPNTSDCAINLLSSPRSTMLNSSSPYTNLNPNFRSRSEQNEFMRTVLEDCVKEWFPFLKEDSTNVDESNENKNALSEKIMRLQNYSIGIKSPEIPLEKLNKPDRNISHLNEDNEDEDLFYNSYNMYKKILSETVEKENNSDSFPDTKDYESSEVKLDDQIKTEKYDEDKKKKENNKKNIEKEIEDIKVWQKEKTTANESETEQGAVIKRKTDKEQEEKEVDKNTGKNKEKENKKDLDMLQKEKSKNKIEYYDKYKMGQDVAEGKEKKSETENEIIYNELNKKEKPYQEREHTKIKSVADRKDKTNNELSYYHFDKENKKYKEIKNEKHVEKKEEKKLSVKENKNVSDIEKNIASDINRSNKVISTEKNNNGNIRAVQEKKASEKNTVTSVEQKKNKPQTVNQDMRNISEIIAEIKEEEAKLQNIKMEQYGSMYMNICVTVLKENANFCISQCSFSAEELKNEKKKIKEILKLYDKMFYAHFNFTPSKFYKESLRPIYTYYQNLKQNISQIENENVAERKSKNPTVNEKKEPSQMKDVTSVHNNAVSVVSTNNVNSIAKEKEKEIGKSQTSSTIMRSSSSNFANLIKDPTLQKVIMDVDTCEDISHLEKDFKYIYRDLAKLKNLLIKKKYYKTILFNYQNQFLEKNNRCVKTYKDIYPVEKEYKIYTQLNKEISEIIKSINAGFKKYYLTTA